MKKALLTAAIIASLGTASVAQGIQPVVSTQSPESLRGIGAGQFTTTQLAVMAGVFAISVVALVAILDDDSTDGTAGTSATVIQ
jgi:hypothetical protein